MAETLGKKARPPRQKPLSERQAEAEAANQAPAPAPIPNVPSEDQLASTLLNGVSELRKYDDKIAAAMATVKGLRADRKGVVAKLGAAGLPASLVKEAMDDADNTRTDIAEKEKARDFIRQTFGLPKADWGDAFDGLPTGAAEEVDWESRGYTAGAVGDDGVAPSECPPERTQNWLTGWNKAQAKRAFEMAPVVDQAFN
jgi:ribosome modulation factor